MFQQYRWPLVFGTMYLQVQLIATNVNQLAGRWEAAAVAAFLQRLIGQAAAQRNNNQDEYDHEGTGDQTHQFSFR
jgi:hypothetical protein